MKDSNNGNSTRRMKTPGLPSTQQVSTRYRQGISTSMPRVKLHNNEHLFKMQNSDVNAAMLMQENE